MTRSHSTGLRHWRIALTLSIALFPGVANAQQEASSDAGMFTLNVYTNLVQLPTLVVGPDGNTLPPFAREQFNLSVDSGPIFHPTKMRFEGDDPITLALLLDVSGGEVDLMNVAANAIASLTPLSLTPHDHVAIFAFDCAIARADKALQAQPGTLKSGIEEILNRPGVHGKKSVSSCYRTHHLWDALAAVNYSLSTLPGRRVLLVITDGFDHGSKSTWNDVRQNALIDSISIIGIRGSNRAADPFEFVERRTSENQFRLLCAGTGGLLLPATSVTLSQTLHHILELLRGRYIIEFPRPSNSTAGSHLIDIKLPNKDAVILPSGVSVPLAGEKELNDPNTIPPDPTKAPTQGKRKILPH